jgi:hypothetical protein
MMRNARRAVNCEIGRTPDACAARAWAKEQVLPEGPSDGNEAKGDDRNLERVDETITVDPIAD